MQRIGKNMFSLAASRIVSGLVTFFVYIKLVTYLGPDDFGRFSLILAFYTIFLLFIDLGMSRYVIKNVSEDKGRGEEYLGNFLLLQLFVAAAIFLIFILLPRIFGYDQAVTQSMLLAGAGLFLAAVALPFSAILQAVQKIHLVALIYFLHSLINAAWMIYAIITGKGLVFIFWAFIIFGLADLLLYIIFTPLETLRNRVREISDIQDRGYRKFLTGFTKKITLPRFSIDKGLIKNMLILGLPFAFISGFEIAVQKIDVVIQKIYLPFSEVGLYSSAYRFLDFLTFLPAVVAISLFPYFSAKTDLNDQESLDTINYFNRYMWILALPLGVFATILGRDIILTLFDERYLGSILPFQILIWVTALTLIYAVPNVMMIVKQTKRTLYILLGIVIFNVLLNLLLVPIYGILASAWITVVSYIIAAGLYIYYTKRQVSYQLFSYAGWPAAASALSGGMLWFVRENLNFFLAGLLASVVYFVILFAVRYLKKEDWAYFKSIFTR